MEVIFKHNIHLSELLITRRDTGWCFDLFSEIHFFEKLAGQRSSARIGYNLQCGLVH
jgi:hypothetical protein